MLEISGNPLTLEQISSVALSHQQVVLHPTAIDRIVDSRRVVERICEEGRVTYGVNTGFGRLSDMHVPTKELAALQLNLVRSHACGVGPLLSESEVRAMMLLRANVLAVGHSGARTEVVQAIIDMLNVRVHPAIPEKGSVGASGDLAPLAHLALAVIGEGKAIYKGELMNSANALSASGLKPIVLGAKEGLALLNGTQAMAAVGGLALLRADRLAILADAAGACTLEALLGTPVAFDERIHAARPHPGQLASAGHLRALLDQSEIRESHRTGDPRVQDAYSLRCMPQVHGAVRGALSHARQVVSIETGSATDNPLVFSDTEEVLSGGNFHGAPLAMAFDYAAIAITDLMSMSERRIDRLVNPDLNEHLPPFLSRDPGTSSGFMIAHVTAVALLNEAKVFAHPASIDNLPTSGGKEDHVSMGMIAATKLRSIVDNAEMIFAIELMCAAEGLEYRKPLRPGRGVEKLYEKVRMLVPRLDADRPLSADIERLAEAIKKGELAA
jgi:histidine ammonia-lyase